MQESKMENVSSPSPSEEKHRVPVKEQKVKKQLSESRIKQLQEARASRSRKAKERKEAKQLAKLQSKQQPEPKIVENKEEDLMEEEEEEEKPTARLVKGGNESATRFMDTFKSMGSNVEVSGMDNKHVNKKRKADPRDDDSLLSVRNVGLIAGGLVGLGALNYVAGKNNLKSAVNSGFTQPGSAFAQEPGQPAIPVQNVLPYSPYQRQSLGLYST